jgi:hypothetical protein
MHAVWFFRGVQIKARSEKVMFPSSDPLIVTFRAFRTWLASVQKMAMRIASRFPRPSKCEHIVY